VIAQAYCNFEFGADAVRAADQDRMAPLPRRLEIEQAAEGADLPEHALAEGAARDPPEPLDGAHLRVDVDARVTIGQPRAARRGTALLAGALRHRRDAPRRRRVGPRTRCSGGADYNAARRRAVKHAPPRCG